MEEDTSQETVITKLQSAITVVKLDTLLAYVRAGVYRPPMGKVPCPPHCSTTHPTNMLFEDTDDYSMYNLTGPPIKPLVVSVKLNNMDLEMKLDTGASISVISEVTCIQWTLVKKESTCYTRVPGKVKNLQW